MTEQQSQTKSYVTNPFDQLYQIEDYIYDNAPVEIKEIISELSEDHYSYYTIDHLDQLTWQIKHHQLNYVSDAIIYYNILTKRLYKARYSNFNKFAQTELRMTSWRCRQVIEAGGVTLKLIAAGHTILPLNSSQAFALSKLDDERLVEVWETVLDIYAPHEITAEKILLVAYPPEPTKLLKPNYIKLSPAIFEKLILGALDRKQSINDFVASLLQNCEYFWWVITASLRLNFKT
ncbi:MAG: hypothetical protein AAF208_05745 [Cyanobacteria bacterium P01_A01_bin.45]